MASVMSQPGTAREALIAEAIGDLARLLDRVETLQPAILESREAVAEAHAQLAEQIAAFESQAIALMEQAKVQAVQYVVAHADEAARRSVETQTRVMNEAAQVLFKSEIDPALQRLALPLRQLAERMDRPWEHWLTHAATAAVASAATFAFATYL